MAKRMVREGSGGWMKQVEEYVHAVGDWSEPCRTDKNEKINLKVNEWEERGWRIEVKERDTLEIYSAKKKMGEGLYLNDGSSVTLFKYQV